MAPVQTEGGAGVSLIPYFVFYNLQSEIWNISLSPHLRIIRFVQSIGFSTLLANS